MLTDSGATRSVSSGCEGPLGKATAPVVGTVGKQVTRPAGTCTGNTELKHCAPGRWNVWGEHGAAGRGVRCLPVRGGEVVPADVSSLCRILPSPRRHLRGQATSRTAAHCDGGEGRWDRLRDKAEQRRRRPGAADFQSCCHRNRHNRRTTPEQVAGWDGTVPEGCRSRYRSVQGLQRGKDGAEGSGDVVGLGRGGESREVWQGPGASRTLGKQRSPGSAQRVAKAANRSSCWV